MWPSVLRLTSFEVITMSSSGSVVFSVGTGINELTITKSAIFEPKICLMCLCSKMCLKNLEILFPLLAFEMVLRLEIKVLE